jgi:hypothetical protein
MELGCNLSDQVPAAGYERLMLVKHWMGGTVLNRICDLALTFISDESTTGAGRIDPRSANAECRVLLTK